MQIEKVKAQVAFGQIFEKLKQSNLSDKDFLNDVIWPLAPLDYLDTHYNFSLALKNYQPEPDKLYTFDESLLWLNKEKDKEGSPLSITFFGDVAIHGNLEIDSYQKIFITGNLEIKGVLEMGSDSRLFVGGKVTAAGIKINGFGELGQKKSSDLLDVAMVAQEIHASEIILCSRNIYAHGIKTKLLVAYGISASLNINYTHYQEGHFLDKKIEVPLHAKHCYLASQTEDIKLLFNQEIFQDSSLTRDPAEEAFWALKRIDMFLDKNYMPVNKEWIWKNRRNESLS